jgi:signal transduction histidine kinase/HPt (histidine-containing phosphotransfer) domain-containing protein
LDGIHKGSGTSILLIEEGRAGNSRLREILAGNTPPAIGELQPCRLLHCPNLSSGLVELERQRFDVILLDLGLKPSGLHALRQVQAVSSEIPIIVMGEVHDERVALKALECGAQDYLLKSEIAPSLLARALRYSIERHRAFKEMKKAQEDAERANHNKSEFLANVSHEIRTPLTLILGYIDSIADPGISELEREEAIETVQHSSHHLLTLVNDTLDLAKIEAGKFEPEIAVCSTFRTIGQVVELMRGRAASKGLYLREEFLFPVPETILTDDTRLRQIVMNLVSNAIKFTKHGGVTVRVGCESALGELFIEVIDTGIGLTLKEQRRIFQPFAQAQSSIHRCFGGTGLGLAISRELAMLLGGNISLMSSPGGGSTFRLTIATGSLKNTTMLESRPPHIVEPKRSRAGSVPRLHGKVLLAEDSAEIRRLVEYFMKNCGLDVISVQDGRTALNEGIKQEFDLILMDMEMPELDGYEAVQELRRAGCMHPIVALTAHTVRQKVERCFDVGCSEHLSKPFKRDQLYAMLSRYLGTAETFSGPILPRLEEIDEEYFEIINDFIERLPEAFARICQEHENANWDRVSALSHKLKGAALFGYPEIEEVVDRIEMAAESRSAAEIGPGLEDLRQLVDRIVAGQASLKELYLKQSSTGGNNEGTNR